MIPIDEVVFFDVITSTPSTSAAVDADSAPTFDVFEEDTDTAILAAQTMTKRTSKTGNYRGTFTASAANGFEAGKWYSVVASGVVGGVTGKVTAMRFRVAPAEAVAGVPKADLTYILGTLLTETAGQIAAAFKKFFNIGTPQATMDHGILVDTVTTYTGNTPQTGDAYARLGAPAGASVSADIAAVKGDTSGIAAIQNNTRVVRVVPTVIERPDSGTVTYRIELLLYDSVGNMEAPDSAPTITLVNQAGTDRSSRLDSTTMALVSTGRYRAIYTADVADTLEQLVWSFSVVEGGATRLYGNQSLIVDTTAVDFTSADRTKLETLATDYTTARAAKIDNLDAAVSTRATPAQVATELGTYDAPTKAELDAAVALLATAATLALVKAKTDLIPAAPAAVGDVPTAAQVADKVLGRTRAGGADGGRTVAQALAPLRNKVAMTAINESAGTATMTVYDDDDTTPLYTYAVSMTTLAKSMTALDPA